MTRKALVVGISTYTHLQHLNLETFANNAEAIAKTLKNDCHFDEVKRLPDIKGTEKEPIIVGKKTPVNKAELEQAIVELFKPKSKFKPTTALLYFTGHGITKKEGFSGGYLVTSDSDLQGNWGLSLKELRELLQDSSIPEQIIWLDSCYSDELLNMNEANPGEQGKCSSRCFMAAATGLAYGDDYYGVFTKALLDGLNPSIHDLEEVNNHSLSVFVNEKLKQTKFPQIPVFSNFGIAIKLRSNYQKNSKDYLGKNQTQVCPYKGLEYFDCNDAQYFYGRENLIKKLVEKIEYSNFLAIVGTSGSGKSSVLRAGLLRQLKLGQKIAGSENWKIQVMLPGETPLHNLAFSWLDPNVLGVEKATQLHQIESLLKLGANGLRTLVQAATNNSNRFILVIDQFEEVFSLCQNLSEREFFFQCLLGALKTTNNFCIVITLRVDFIGKCFEHEYSGLFQKIDENSIKVLPMNKEELRETIVKPAKKANLEVEQYLIDQILKDIEDYPGTLPLLQYTLTELWKQQESNQLTLASYVKLGGIVETLNKRATLVYNNFSEEEKKIVEHIFLCLTQLGEEDRKDTRRRVLKGDLFTAKFSEELMDSVVNKLADEKLIITSEQLETTSENRRQVLINVVHEALITNWILLRNWLDIKRSDLFLLKQREIEAVAEIWRRKNRKNEYLLQGKLLKEALIFQKNYHEDYPLSDLAKRFINKSNIFQSNKYRKFLSLFLLTPLFSIIGGYLIYNEVKHLELLENHKKIIENCEKKEFCPGRIEALESLLRANINLKSYNLSHANLKGADFLDANLTNLNLQDVNLSAANLISSNLKNADLKGAILDNAFLENADLKGANFKNVSTKGTYFNNTVLIDANNLMYSQIKLSCYWEQAIFKGYWDNRTEKWVVNESENLEFIKLIKQDKSSEPKIATNCPQLSEKHH